MDGVTMSDSGARGHSLPTDPPTTQTLLAWTIQLLAETVRAQGGEWSHLGPDTVPWSELELDSAHLVWVGSGLQERLGTSLDVASVMREIDVRTLRRMTLHDFAEHLSAHATRTPVSPRDPDSAT
jgi:hypothetical protein